MLVNADVKKKGEVTAYYKVERAATGVVEYRKVVGVPQLIDNEIVIQGEDSQISEKEYMENAE